MPDRSLTLLHRLILLPLFWLCFSPATQAQFGLEDELLPAEQAFALRGEATADGPLLRWTIAEGYYLYRDRIQVRSSTPGVSVAGLELPAGKMKDDEFFGRMEIYRGELAVPVRLTGAEPGQSVELAVKSQGCAERGVCYPPHEQTLRLQLAAAPAPAPAAAPTPSALDRLRALGAGLGLDDGDDLLPPEQAFRPQALAEPGVVQLRWEIAEGYYLYRDKLDIALVDPPAGVSLGALQLPQGKQKQDEIFGQVEVYYEVAEGRATVQGLQQATPLTLEVGYQGCAERGVCYPPQKQRFDLTLAPAAVATTPTAAMAPAAPAVPAPAQTEQDRLAGMIADASLWTTLAVFFGAGLLLAFTPCVFPMIPILSSIIVGAGDKVSTGRAFSLSLVYVLAMATTYAVAGIVAGLFGENLQAAFQNPWILGSFATVFVLLALSMFGFYDLQLPASWQGRLSEVSNKQQGGSLGGVAVMGLLSALIVGPCVAAPLAGALIYIGQSGDPVLGFAALFALGLGMGAPLLAIGTGLGSVLPRAGAWMDAVKAVFGVLLLAVAIWMLERILPGAVSLGLWAALLIASAIYLGALEPLAPEAGGWKRLWKATGVVLLGWGALTLIGAASGGKGDLLQPLRGIGAAAGGGSTGAIPGHVSFQPVKGETGLDAALAAASAVGRPVMLDFYADWCVECKKMEKTTFSDPGVIEALDGVTALQADVTPNDAQDKALYQRFGIIGPPAILFFDANGEEIRDRRLIGYFGPEEFSAWVEATY